MRSVSAPHSRVQPSGSSPIFTTAITSTTITEATTKITTRNCNNYQQQLHQKQHRLQRQPQQQAMATKNNINNKKHLMIEVKIQIIN